MNTLLYWVARALVGMLQLLPLRVNARLGRIGGFIWWLVDFKHRGLVRRSLAQAFPEKSGIELRALSREIFQRIGENGFAAVKTAALNAAEIEAVCELRGLEKLPKPGTPGGASNVIAAIGHFGNFEVHANLCRRVSGWQGATTYRGMNQPGLDKVVQALRERSGCLFFERRSEAAALKEALAKGGILLGLLSDQRPSKGGVIVPFMGRDCTTSSAPAVFALRYDAPLFPVICYRIALGRWRIEIGDEIPLRENGRARAVRDIMVDVNRAFETAVRRDPANWFWVHDRWKKPRLKRASAARANDPEMEPGFPSV